MVKMLKSPKAVLKNLKNGTKFWLTMGSWREGKWSPATKKFMNTPMGHPKFQQRLKAAKKNPLKKGAFTYLTLLRGNKGSKLRGNKGSKLMKLR